MRRLLLAGALLAAASCPAAAVTELDKEFAGAAAQLEVATVNVLGVGSGEGNPGSSGILIHPDGWILSDADAGLIGFQNGPKGPKKVYAPKLEVRLPGGKSFKASVVRRNLATDSSLIRIEEAAGMVFPFLRLGDSQALRVGSWSMLCGNAFGLSKEGKPSVSLGVVAALHEGRIVTSAAVNPGSNGGPCVDVEGGLVGIVSSWGVDRTSPWFGMGLITPLHILREKYKDLPDFAKLFPDPRGLAPKTRWAPSLQEAFHAVGRKAGPAVGSLILTREAGVTKTEITKGPDGKPQQVPAYGGPVSAVVWSADGYVVTAVDNLWAREKILSAVLALPDGRTFPAVLKGRDQVRGLALFKVEAQDLPCLEHADAGKLQVGQFVFALGNPYGTQPPGDPFLTFGMLSATHQLDKNHDAFQTDAAMNDANMGGALVDLRGRLIGLNIPVNTAQFGRNSGIGFSIPLSKIEEALPRLKEGKNVVPGFFGINVQPDPSGKVVIAGVVPGGGADKAGVAVGDVVVEFAGQAIQNFDQLRALIVSQLAGDEVVLKVVRGEQELELKALLGEGPGA